MEIRYWKQLERHPLSAEYQNLTGKGWEAFLSNFRTYGIVNGRPITLHEGKVLDGWQLQRACVEADVKPGYRELKLPMGMTVETWVETVNDLRRHEEMGRTQERAAARRQRVTDAIAAGQSQSAVAEAECVSRGQVRRDIAKAKAKAKAAAKPEPPPDLDAYGTSLPDRCKAAFKDPWIQNAIDCLAEIITKFREERLADGMQKRKKHYPFFNSKDFADGCGIVDSYLEQLLEHLKTCRPASVCASCSGAGCAKCMFSGLLPRRLQ